MIGFIVFILLLFFQFVSQSINYTSDSYFTNKDVTVGKYLKRLIDQDGGAKIFVGRASSDKWAFTNILVASQEPDKFVTELTTIQYLNAGEFMLNKNEVEEIKNKGVKYLLLPPDVIPISNELKLTKIKHFDNWDLFKTKNP